MKAGDAWLVAVVTEGIQKLLTLCLDGAPAREVATGTMMAWVEAISTGRDLQRDLDETRIRAAFIVLMRESRRWPTPRQLLDAMPARKQQQALPRLRSDDERAEAKKNLDAILATLNLTPHRRMTMLVQRLGNHTLPVPSKATDGAAAFDLCAADFVSIAPGDHALVPTGFAWQVPVGFVGLVCPRSGLALKCGVTVLNAPGVIDSDYRGEVGVILVNHGSSDFHIAPGDRIAQLLLTPAVGGCCVTEVPLLGETKRGAGGFGSTGVAGKAGGP
jgi:dUTP pyrophosphatase